MQQQNLANPPTGERGREHADTKYAHQLKREREKKKKNEAMSSQRVEDVKIGRNNNQRSLLRPHHRLCEYFPAPQKALLISSFRELFTALEDGTRGKLLRWEWEEFC